MQIQLSRASRITAPLIDTTPRTVTIVLPYQQAKDVLSAAEQYKIVKRQRDSLSLSIGDLNMEVAHLKSVITNNATNDSLGKQQLALALDALSKSQEEKKLLDDNIKKLDKALRRAQIGKKIIAGLGVAVTGILAFLFISK